MNKNEKNRTGAKTRRVYDETYKRHAVELTLRGDRTAKAVAKELDVPVWSLYEWRRLYAPKPGEARPSARTLSEAEQENVELRAEILRMREREMILKKAMGLLSETPANGMPRLKR
jgi:transposase